MPRSLTTAAACLALAATCAAQTTDSVGIDEKLGAVVPLSELTFRDEAGETVTLDELVDRPVILTLVYFRCPSICTPLLQELARVSDNASMQPGDDYELVTVSFDPADGPQEALKKKESILAEYNKKAVDPDAWHYLTGEPEMIARLTESVGFQYTEDEVGEFIHGATVMFLSPDGKIVRYLNGKEFNPVELEMAITDANEGRPRSFMQRMRQICFAYDPVKRGYQLQLDRVILGVTLLFSAGFVAFLVRKGASRPRSSDDASSGGEDA